MMQPTRKTQPYRASGSRGPSQVLSAMQQGAAAGQGNALMRAYKGSQGTKRQGISVPRTVPWHKRK